MAGYHFGNPLADCSNGVISHPEPFRFHVSSPVLFWLHTGTTTPFRFHANSPVLQHGVEIAYNTIRFEPRSRGFPLSGFSLG